MKQKLDLLKTSPLFAGITQAELESVISYLKGEEMSYLKNEMIYRVGQKNVSIGFVLSGSVMVMKEDFWGNRSILAQIGAGEIFGEAYACMPDVPLGVNVIAAEKAQILFLSSERIVSSGNPSEKLSLRLIQNFISILAQKNFMLTEKMEFLTKRSIREKVMSYLSAQSQKQGKEEFYIPFSRQELADYLSVDRSALSSELGRLKAEGALDFQKNHFWLYRTEE